MAENSRRLTAWEGKRKAVFSRLSWYTTTGMFFEASILSRRNVQRALALVGGLVLLYFAVGTFVHEHKGSETNCSICQALHTPAIAGAPLGRVAEPQPAAWQNSLSAHTAPTDSFHLRAASRAPPA